MRDPLIFLRRLEAQPGSYDFYAALRQLECAYADRPRIGQSLRPQDDALRFGQNISLGFEPAMLASLTGKGGAAAARLEVNFFGLCGANGPLPLHLTEYVRDRMRNSSDFTLSRFLDLFHHRMISLLYRAWASAQPTVSMDRPKSDRFADYVGSFIGIGSAPLQERDAVPDLAKLHYAGRLAGQTRNAAGLAAILSDFFRLPVRLRQFIGHWMTLPADSRCVLRSGPEAQVLGQTTALGKKVWNCQHKFRIVIGPVDYAQFRQMLPGGASAGRLLAWVKNYAGLTFNWDVNLVLKKEQVPPLVLGRQTHLGWTTWLISKTPEKDDSQLCFAPTRAPVRLAH